MARVEDDGRRERTLPTLAIARLFAKADMRQIFLVPDEDYQLLADLLAIAPERGELVGRRPGRRHAQAGQAARRRHVADARFDNGAHGVCNGVTELRGSE